MTQELKMELETIKKIQKEANLEMGNLGKWSGATDASATNRIQDIEESQVQKIPYKILTQQ